MEAPFSIEAIAQSPALDAPHAGPGAGDAGFFHGLSKDLRLNFDLISRLEVTSRRGEVALVNAAGLDLHKTFSDESGNIGTMVLQPYVVRRDNQYSRLYDMNDDDAFVLELHASSFNLTRFGQGRTNLRVGHFDVPFGLEPLVDTHFTLQQYLTHHNVGFHMDWGAALNGALPEFDYEVAVTRGTGEDLNDRGHDTYLASGRIGTPSDRNTVLGLSALYGEVADRHGTHRVDEGNPVDEDFREREQWVRRWRVGADATHLVDVFALRGEASAGEDFDQAVWNLLGEVEWTAPDGALSTYVQGAYLAQNGWLGWDADVRMLIGLEWHITHVLSFSAQWTHEFETYFDVEGGAHSHEDTYTFQMRARF